MDWSVSNIVFYLCIIVAALFMAIDQAIKDSATFRTWVERRFRSPRWDWTRYLPLILLIVAGVMIVSRAMPTPPATVSPVAERLAPSSLPTAIPTLASSDDRELGDKSNELTDALRKFAQQRGYRKRIVVVACLDDDPKSCELAHTYSDAIGLAAGWTPTWGGPIP
jgi:hypothetical protein